MHLDRILELLAKQMGNAASEEELAELEQLLRLYPNHRHLVSILQSIQSKKLKQPAHNEELVVREAWEKLQEQLGGLEVPGESPAPVRRLFGRTFVKWAAVWICLVVGAAVLWFGSGRRRHDETVIASVSHGKPEKKILPDGSVVWINAGSTISYKADRDQVSVYLEGEAYFQVKHEAGRAFVVYAGNIAVKALGTAFNVSAYPGEDHVEATLLEGKVQVTMKEKPDQKIILAPNEKFTVVNKRAPAARNEISYEVKPVKSVPGLTEAGETAWMQDELVFQDEVFSDLAKRMERRFNVHIAFGDTALKKETLSGIFKNEDIGKALRFLQMTTPFQYHIKGDSVYLERPG